MTYHNTFPEKQEKIARFMRENPRAGNASIEQIPDLDWCKSHLLAEYGADHPIIIGESDPKFSHFRWQGFRSDWLDNTSFHAEIRVMSNEPYIIASLYRVRGHDKREDFIILSTSLYYSNGGDPDSALEYLLKDF
jgi:hypothetical protein